MTCTRCGNANLVPDDFAWKNKAKGRRHSHCRNCQARVSKSHYLDNREDYISRAKGRYADNREVNEVKLAEYLSNHGCQTCTETNPETLDFVHRKGTEKKDTVRRLIGQSWEIVEAEITKCRLQCANCRRKGRV